MTNKDITAAQNTLPVAPADQTFALMQQGIKDGISTENMEKLMSMQERIMDRNAKSDFVVALTEFQARCPAIAKRHSVKDRGGRLMYKFAPLEDIVEQIKGLLSDLGLSYSFDSDVQPNGAIEVICVVRHRSGHQERTSVFIPATQGHNTNASQNMAIQLTYGKRYALIGALGIVTADQDQDGNAEKLRPINAQQAADLTELAEEVGADQAKFLKYLGARSFADIPERDYHRAVSALEAKRSGS